jgi:hypothetical protein
MGCCDICGDCPTANTDLISAEAENDEKQYSGSVESPHTTPSSSASRGKGSTRAILVADLNRVLSLDYRLPLFPCYALKKSRLCLFLRPSPARFQIFWYLFCCHRWDCVANDRFVLLQGLATGGANDKMLL